MAADLTQIMMWAVGAILTIGLFLGTLAYSLRSTEKLRRNDNIGAEADNLRDEGHQVKTTKDEKGWLNGMVVFLKTKVAVGGLKLQGKRPKAILTDVNAEKKTPD